MSRCWWPLFAQVLTRRWLGFELWWNVWWWMLRYSLYWFLAWSSSCYDYWFFLYLFFLSLFVCLFHSFNDLVSLRIILLDRWHDLLLFIFLFYWLIKLILSSSCSPWAISCHLAFPVFWSIFFDLSPSLASLVLVNCRQIGLTAQKLWTFKLLFKIAFWIIEIASAFLNIVVLFFRFKLILLIICLLLGLNNSWSSMFLHSRAGLLTNCVLAPVLDRKFSLAAGTCF